MKRLAAEIMLQVLYMKASTTVCGVQSCATGGAAPMLLPVVTLVSYRRDEICVLYP